MRRKIASRPRCGCLLTAGALTALAVVTLASLPALADVLLQESPGVTVYTPAPTYAYTYTYRTPTYTQRTITYVAPSNAGAAARPAEVHYYVEPMVVDTPKWDFSTPYALGGLPVHAHAHPTPRKSVKPARCQCQ